MSARLAVSGFEISDDSDCFVIAEVGHNHQGSVERCKEIFDIAANCGAQAVKLQKRDNRTLYSSAIYNAPYESRNSFGATYGEHREFLEFDRDEYVEVWAYAREKGLFFFATPFDMASVDFLEGIDVPAYKTASADITNTPLLKHVASCRKPIFMSTGGASMDDVRRAYETVSAVNSEICVMQCTASYPCEFDQLNLKVIETYRREFPDAVVGLSGHDNGIAMAMIAYTLGARVVEKHVTFNRAAKGTDHSFSLERSGLRRLCRDLKRARLAMGDGEKRIYEAERAPLYKMAKKLVAARDLPEGHVMTRKDIAIKVPNDGLPPYELVNVVGKRLVRPVSREDNIRFEDMVAAP